MLSFYVGVEDIVFTKYALFFCPISVLLEKESKTVGLKKEDAINRARWRVGLGEIAGRVG